MVSAKTCLHNGQCNMGMHTLCVSTTVHEHHMVQEPVLGSGSRTQAAMASSSNPQQPGLQGQSRACACSKAVPAVALVPLGTFEQDLLRLQTTAGLHMSRDDVCLAWSCHQSQPQSWLTLPVQNQCTTMLHISNQSPARLGAAHHHSVPYMRKTTKLSQQPPNPCPEDPRSTLKPWPPPPPTPYLPFQGTTSGPPQLMMMPFLSRLA